MKRIEEQIIRLETNIKRIKECNKEYEKLPKVDQIEEVIKRGEKMIDLCKKELKESKKQRLLYIHLLQQLN